PAPSVTAATAKASEVKPAQLGTPAPNQERGNAPAQPAKAAEAKAAGSSAYTVRITPSSQPAPAQPAAATMASVSRDLRVYPFGSVTELKEATAAMTKPSAYGISV